MLQMVPKLSKDKASALQASADCTCPRKLRRLFHESGSGSSGCRGSSGSASSSSGGEPTSATLTPAQRMLLLQGHFGRSKSGKPSNQAKLSRHLYHLVTALDPQGLIKDI